MSPDQYIALLEKSLFAIMCGIGSLGVYFIRDMSRSVAELNKKIAAIMQKVLDHEKRISKLEKT